MLEPGFYQHYKGGIYYVLGIFINTETDEQMVGYTNFKENWIRRLSIFTENLNGLPRFGKIKKEYGELNALVNNLKNINDVKKSEL